MKNKKIWIFIGIIVLIVILNQIFGWSSYIGDIDNLSFLKAMVKKNLAVAVLLYIVFTVVGCVVLALGMSIVINSNAGTGPNDLIAIILSDKIPAVEFRWVRVGCDLFFVLLGCFLGGTVGAGTIVAVFLTGPLVQFWLPKTKRFMPK